MPTKSLLKPLLFLAILLIWPLPGRAGTSKGKINTKVQLTNTGEALKAQYEKKIRSLRSAITAALPSINTQKKQAYIKALESEKAAILKLDKIQKSQDEVKKAQGLVNHAKGKWIGGADRGIARAEAMLKKASTADQRKAARQELEKWQKNRAAGVKALEERQAILAKIKTEQSELARDLKNARKELVLAKNNLLKALKDLDVDQSLKTDKLDKKLIEFVILNEATASGLAEFAQKDKEYRQMIDQLFKDEHLMQQMLLADGAKNGAYGPAMKIYTDIQKSSSKAKTGALQRLALAISLEHAVPVPQRNPKAQTDGPATVDPVKRYLHYEKALLNNELDPAFKFFTVWDYRMVVDGNEPDEALAWGREMLRTYRPDQITTADYRWRYVMAVKTDIRYGSDQNKFDKPELHFFQNILMNGGICGRRAFYGRFILRAFGIPTIARPQRGHAALAHWTPKGWVICLGAGWGSGWTKTNYKSDLDFLASTQARVNQEKFFEIKRAQWFGDVTGEKRVYGLSSGEPDFWNSVSLNTQRIFIENSGVKALAAVGTDIAEANESRIKEKVKKISITTADKKILTDNNGVITIPAAACSKPTNNTGKIKFMPGYSGGMQLHYERNGKPEDFIYTLEVPADGQYSLTAKVASSSWKQNFLISVNEGSEMTDMQLPHTLGLWETSKPVTIFLTKGKNTLRFSAGKEDPIAGKRIKGVSFKEFTLTPVKSR